MEKLLAIDERIFRFVNITLHNDIVAFLMKFLANDIFLIVFLGVSLYLFYKMDPLKWKKAVAFSLWALIITNIISSWFLKPIFKRPRPVAVIPDANMLFYLRKLGYAFPSTHTAMMTALCVVLWDDYPKARPFMALFVVLVAFFCVYTGGHWPLDTMAGAGLGYIIGMIFRAIKNRESPQGASLRKL